VIFPEHLINTDFLFKDQNNNNLKIANEGNGNKKAKEKKSSSSHKAPVKQLKNDYFKRLVLAAEIASQLYQEPTFGHVKFAKIQYLFEHTTYMQINSNYGRYAAGPLDPKHTHAINNEFRKRKWFKVTKNEYGGFRYEPDENINDYKQYYLNYFNNQLKEINYLIGLFKKQKSEFCEVVATLFSVWQDFTDRGEAVTQPALLQNFYEWNEKKKRFEKHMLTEAIKWMKQNKVCPLNFRSSI
jgi:hypothetical protein